MPSRIGVRSMIEGDVLVAVAGVSPDVLIDTDDRNAVEAPGVLDQDPTPLGQDRIVGRVPRHSQRLGDPGDAQVPDHQPLQRPAPRTTRQPGAWFGCGAGVLTPHVPAPGAPVPADRDQQRRRSPTQRLVRQFPSDRVSDSALAPAAPTPGIRLYNPAGQDRPAGLEPLAEDFQAELVQAAERGQIRADEGSVRHVEVFQMGSVRTSILGRPRPLPRHRRAARYTLNCEEPPNHPSPARHTGEPAASQPRSARRVAALDVVLAVTATRLPYFAVNWDCRMRHLFDKDSPG